jgi:hypothetical protein
MVTEADDGMVYTKDPSAAFTVDNLKAALEMLQQQGKGHYTLHMVDWLAVQRLDVDDDAEVVFISDVKGGQIGPDDL